MQNFSYYVFQTKTNIDKDLPWIIHISDIVIYVYSFIHFERYSDYEKIFHIYGILFIVFFDCLDHALQLIDALLRSVGQFLADRLGAFVRRKFGQGLLALDAFRHEAPADKSYGGSQGIPSVPMLERG